MKLIDEEKSRVLPCISLSPEKLRSTTGKLATRILSLLATHPKGLHASEIARQLNEHEQKIYYHIHKLRKAGAIHVDHLEESGGGTAKVLRVTAPAFCTTFKEMEPLLGWNTQNPAHAKFLNPFIAEGEWNGRIVVGSPDPHGPESARGRDAAYAIDLGLFLGLFLNTPPKQGMLLDISLTDWKRNLIIIGGPVVNKAADRVNQASLSPYENKAFRSKRTGKVYDQENVGVIVKMPNPRAKGSWILLIAGKRYLGTKAAILMFLQKFDELCAKVQEDGTCLAVVEGVDADSDGIIDSINVLE